MAKDKTPKTIFIFDIFAVLIALIPVVNSVVYMHTDKRMDYHLLLLLVLISFIVIAFTSASLLYTYPKFLSSFDFSNCIFNFFYFKFCF